MKNIFDSYFESHFKKINVLSKKGFEKSARSYQSLYRDFLPKDKNIKILDVGCGTGQFLYFLKKQGYTDYYGIDASKQQIKFCKEKVTKKVEVADVSKFLKGKKNHFDVIVANDILEHIPKNRLMKILDLIYASLKNNGTVLIKVPNMSNPFGLMDRYMDITHEIGFTEYSLSEVLEMTGFQDVKIKGASYPVTSLKSAFGKIGELPFYGFLRLMFRMQGHAVPKFMDKDIIAMTVKRKKIFER